MAVRDEQGLDEDDQRLPDMTPNAGFATLSSAARSVGIDPYVCFWCGEGFGPPRDLELRRTRDHLTKPWESDRTKRNPVVPAHALCNHERQHEPWVPYPQEPGPEQRSAAERVRRLLDTRYGKTAEGRV